MQQLLETLSRFLSRFRYPVSLPADVANDLGLELPNHISFEEFLERLSSPLACPTTLWKAMNRYMAENTFKFALKKEIFHSNSFFSYYFSRGWVVIALYFDEKDNLRRIYVQCPHSEEMEGFDLPLEERKFALPPLQTLAK